MSTSISSTFSNENNDETESSIISIESQNTKKHGGRKFSLVWEHITRGKETARGHYEGTCKYCSKYWKIARPSILQIHLASQCSKCPTSIILQFCQLVAENEQNIKRQKINSISPSSSESKKQTSLEHHFEKTSISITRQKVIDNILIKTFITCNFAFCIIEHLFFIELLKALCIGYQPPSRKKLATELLGQEIARITLKLQYIFENTNNLTLGRCII